MGGNTGNTGNTGNVGNLATLGDPGDGWTFADRVNYPVVDDPNLDQTPFPVVAMGYPDRCWGAYWYAWRVLTEFVTALWPAMIEQGGANEITMPDPGGFDAADEIRDLIELARLERADALAEIIAQKDEFVSYFMGLLNASPHSYPNTQRVLTAASHIALFAAMYFKDKFARQRPSQLCPPLLPPFEVPGHASYPSGHATQSRLMARCMEFVLTRAALGNSARLTNDLQGLAARIARNREIGGFHYQSDSTEGQNLADAMFAQLEADLALADPDANGAPKMSRLNRAVRAAIKEWQ